MSTEEEFSKWLRRKEKTFEENFKFAIKAWQSVEFTLTTKYEMILQWLTEQDQLKQEEFVSEDFRELLKLRAQPGLITQKVKRDFVEWLLKKVKESEDSTRNLCELLHLLVEYELLQDLYRMNYEIQCQVYGAIFKSHEKYLRALEDSKKPFLNTFESEFVASVLKSLKETIKRCGDVVLFEKAFTALCLPNLVEALLFLRCCKVDFFDELLEIERLICLEMEQPVLIKRVMILPLHVRLFCLECSIVNRRDVESFLILLLKKVFHGFLTNSANLDPSLSLTVAAYAMEMLGRHDVSLSLKIENDTTALEFLGKQLYTAVKSSKDSNLKEVLMLLCAALRLNPLILEQNIFEITAWMILAAKSADKEEQQLFEEFLVLLMDMFRRLSRAEKFVTNLLKSLNENLKKVNFNLSKKRKGILDTSETPLNKKKKLEELKSEEFIQDSIKYLNILFQDFFKPILTKQTRNDNCTLTASASFTRLQQFWPSNPVGLAFSKIITGLVSKPSLTIWKSLLFGLKELVENFQNQSELDEKSLFQLDFHTALLSQYFAGCKLAEQSDKFLQELQNQRELTLEVLKQFGKFLLKKEHHPRTMTAFLELSYYSSCFELLLIYYRPDGCEHESLQPVQAIEKLHSFLSQEEWTLIQQRVLNFGKSSCKHLLQRLKLQKSQASLLLLSTNNTISLKTSDPETLNSFLKTRQAKWYLQHVSRADKEAIAAYLVNQPELLHLAFNDLELLEFVALAIYEKLCMSFTSKNSLLKSLSCDFENVRQCVEVTANELLIKQLIEVIVLRSEDESKVKKLDTEQIKRYLDLLCQLPLGQLRRQRKTIIFALHLSLYRDLKAACEHDLSLQALEIMKDLLHFGQQVLIFKYLPTSTLLKLLPAETCWELYEFLFSTVKNEEKGTEQFLQGLSSILEESQSAQNINEEHRKLLLAAIDTLSSLNGPCAKRMRKYLETFLIVFSEYLQNHFAKASDGTSKKDKKFVQKTLAGFASYAASILVKTDMANEIKTCEVPMEGDSLKQQVDEDFRRISKIYIGHSMDYRNPNALRLMQVALSHRELLHLDQDEIEFVLTKYWSQIKDDLKQPLLKQHDNTTESAVKMIIGNKTNEDLLLTLKTIATDVEETNFSNILRLLTLIAKCPFSTIKGAIFNEQYKQITFNITLLLCRNEQQQFKDYDLIINLLNCHQSIIDNKMVPMSTDALDSILSFLMDVNIKKFSLCDTNLKLFNSLHLAMTEVCSSLIKHRHILLMDRVPQFMHIFKDLLQSIVWYKSDRQKDTAFPTSEIDDLAKLALKLEALMHLIAQHSVWFKRLAPFVLTFVINLMVANKRPTTLYNKIKTHIENVCYELVGICDHRVSRFILRCSNEAGRQLYELLVKDYQKYHKFKGKV